eukprot:TCALIF_01690-PA protein Name:"Protein of unknown function" AED:0.00 eAED:0.00 QI:104/1/1/1/1/1/3/324/270
MMIMMKMMMIIRGINTDWDSILESIVVDRDPIKLPSCLEETKYTMQSVSERVSIPEEEEDGHFEAPTKKFEHAEVLPWNILESPPPLDGKIKKEFLPFEGSWCMIAMENVETYLRAIGVTPLMAQMVVRSEYLITVYEDIDHAWKVLTETSIKAKNVKGFKCRNYKMTSNKFHPEQPKPELLDDWDPRLVVTTVTLEDHDTYDKVLVMDQIAEQDQRHNNSSTLFFEAQGDNMIIRLETENGVKAKRFMVRHKPQDKNANNNIRKVSAPF